MEELFVQTLEGGFESKDAWNAVGELRLNGGRAAFGQVTTVTPPEHRETLLKALTDESEDVREQAIVGLAKRGDGRSTMLEIEQLPDGWESNRLQAEPRTKLQEE